MRTMMQCGVRLYRPHPSEGGYYFDRDYRPLTGVALTSTDTE